MDNESIDSNNTTEKSQTDDIGPLKKLKELESMKNLANDVKQLITPTSSQNINDHSSYQGMVDEIADK